ncbi:MAG: sigma-70 family RNA polymerase sigma factor [Oscillospiraceae bacterium]
MDKADEALARRLVKTYSNQLLRVAYSLLNSVPDAQDVCQEVFIKRLGCSEKFESDEHERAWLIRVTLNTSKNVLRSPWHRRIVALDTAAEQAYFQPEEGSVLEEVQRLPIRDREVLVLYYYMGYDTNEIGALLDIRADTVRTRMKRARQKLKHELEEQGYGTL